MARTVRCRGITPKGFVVRDGGFLACEGIATTQQERNLIRKGRWSRNMIPPQFRRSPYRKEKKPARKATYRRYSARVKNLMYHEEWERIPQFRRTSGWETW